jgi:hypothetical protein
MLGIMFSVRTFYEKAASEMSDTRHSDTIVIQTFRKHSIPAWIQRCLDSVGNWAAVHGHDYSLAGDEFYQLCGSEYLARGNKNSQVITDLARLVATRQQLDAGYKKVIWMDADVFVFDPMNLIFDFPSEHLPTGYAFGYYVHIYRNGSGAICVMPPAAHNAATFFTQAEVDLDMLITLIRHIDSKRQVQNNFQLGITLLQGLQNSLMFPTCSHVAAFSSDLIRAIVNSDQELLRIYGEAYRYPAYAANLAHSIQHETTENVIWQAMNRLEAEAGGPINKYATETGVHLVPYA